MATAGEDDDEDGYSLKEEIEMLEAIYIHELTIKGRKDRPSSISLLLHPSTGEEDDKKYVCLTLEIILTNEYPNELPSIKIRNPRGLSEDHDCFTKTDCYHYFHCHCLLRYIDYHLNHCDENSDDSSAQQIICPMCREPITYDLDALKSAPDLDDNEEKIVYHADAEMKRLQREMSKLYNQQLQKGAIINVEEEKNKAVISLNMVNYLNSPYTLKQKWEITEQHISTSVSEK
ncbi:E3 ubiquitin-protein ligase RNF25 [Exaiptasia diaphana]|uniref:RWD domain-containing protein n=1 Tax=Exaiptasia diaphana TaxID=2652724 RepID=A0A913YUJ8_EXADI|nr:E3 ubiquitin-protein ligase RNF25 [Exaiptasia diaphana]